MAISTVAAGATGIVVVAAAPAATAGEQRPSLLAPRSSGPVGEPSLVASPSRFAQEASVELLGLPGEFVPGADWQEFTVVLHQTDAAKQFNRVFFQVHDTKRVGLKAHQIKVEYFLDGQWQTSLSYNDPEDNWQDFPVPQDKAPLPADTTEIPVRLKFGEDSPLADRIDIGALAYYGQDESVQIQPLKVIRLVRDTPGEPSPTASPTAGPTEEPGQPSPTASPTAGPTEEPGQPGPTAGPTDNPGEPSPELPDPSATPTSSAPGGGAAPGASPSGSAAPASGGELARTGAAPLGTPLIVGLIALGAGTVITLAVRAARAARLRRH